MKTIMISLSALCLLASVAMAGDVELSSHQATYAMKQLRQFGREQSFITRVDGVLRYKFTQSCDAWMVEHNSAMHMDYENGQQLQMTWNYTSWEAKDGSKFRFRSTSKHNGVVTDRFQGEARRENGKTIAIYAEPNGRRIEMPKDILFPTAHQKKAIGLAMNGENLFSTPYFDGSGDEADFEVSSVMTLYKGKPVAMVGETKLEKLPVWAIQLAFFSPDSQASEPEMEIGARYRKDGVSTYLRHDFGDLILEGDLVEFSYLPKQECN